MPGHDDNALVSSYEQSYRMSPSSRLAAMMNSVVKACGRNEIEITSSAPVFVWALRFLASASDPSFSTVFIESAAPVSPSMRDRGNPVARRPDRKRDFCPLARNPLIGDRDTRVNCAPFTASAIAMAAAAHASAKPGAVRVRPDELYGGVADQPLASNNTRESFVIDLPKRHARCAVLLMALCVPVLAQDAATGRVSYDAAFYGAFAPRTALDMINQTPGFVFDPGDEEVRGFTGAVGNVLIDGQRLSAKSQTLSDVLERVPAAEVVRIELLRGAEVAGDASGAAMLANVIRTRTANSGTWELGTEVTNEREPAPAGRFAWSGRNEATQYSVGANAYTHDHTNGIVRETSDGTGTPVAESRGAFPHTNGEYALNGEVSLPAADGKLTVTGQAEYLGHTEDWWLTTTTPEGAQIEDETAPFEQTTRSGELGVNWQQPLGDWALELVGLATRKQYDSEVLYTHFNAADLQDLQQAQSVDQDSGETILRGTLTRTLGGGKLEAGGEAALNTLDGSSDLTEDIGGGPIAVDVPNADLSVEEKRGEVFVAFAAPLGTHWSFDARLAAEYSRLDFTGDTELSEKLTYVKPRAQVTRKLGPHQVQFRVYRDVGQLDFTDFVSTAQLADGVIAGGNPQLRPQSAWAIEADTDLRFPGDAALRVRLFRHYLDDVVDFVPVGEPGEQFDAPGNIGEGTLTGVEMSLRLPLKAVLPGGTLSINATLQDSDATDPTTGADRDISELIEDEVSAELRQDLPALKFAWGLSFESFSPDTDYKLREVDSFRQLRMLNAFVETTVIAGFKLKLAAESINSDTEKRDRQYYEPDRNGALAFRELSHFRPGTWWTLTFSGKF